MGETPEHGDRRRIEGALEARPVGIVPERRRRQPVRAGDPVVGGDDGMALDPPATDHGRPALNSPPVDRIFVGSAEDRSVT